VTDLDDRVRTLLETRARDVSVDPRLPETVSRRSRRRRALVGTGVGLATVAVLVGGVAALQTLLPRAGTGIDPTPTGAPSVSPPPSPTTTPSLTPSPEPPAGAPATFVGVRAGEIVLVEVASGNTVGTLVDRAAVGGGEVGAIDLELSPDGSTLYFVPFGTPERIMSVPMAGGEPTLVADGRKPSVSADGRWLAYLDCSSPFVGCGNAIVVRDLRGDGLYVWDVGADEQWVGQLAWLPDSRSLAYSMFYAGDSNPTMHLLDTVGDRDVELRSIAKVGPDRIGAGWTVVGYHAPTQSLAVRHYCCSTQATDEVDESAVLSVATDGRVLSTLLERADWLDIELDASARHFLLADQGRDVYRLDDSGQPVFVAGGFEDVVW
jgi:hypothetical protein